MRMSLEEIFLQVTTEEHAEPAEATEPRRPAIGSVDGARQ